MRRKLVAGNWKMNTTRDAAVALARAVAAEIPAGESTVEVMVAPPFPYLIPVREALGGSGVRLGAQDVYHEAPGAFTGEIAPEMLLDVGCEYVLIGHSERRHVIGETDVLINRKLTTALAKGLKPVLCVGELLADREAGRTESVLDQQMEGGLAGVDAARMRDIVIAYEPVWAIGTGRTATPEQAEAAHAHIRAWLAARYGAPTAEATLILYGGSVKPDNAESLLRQGNVDGALVGGACLKADQFLAIARAATQAMPG